MPKIFFHKNAEKQLQKISKISNADFEKIDSDINTLSNYPDIQTLCSKKLKGEYSDYFCLKAKKYRIKFVFENKCIYIIDIRHRKDSYKK